MHGKSSLFLLFIIVISVFLYTKFLIKDKKIRKYELRSDFFNCSEFIFYQLLEEKVPKEFMIFSKTRIEDFIRVRSGFGRNEYWGLRSRIKSRHVDFLICNAQGHPKLAIEIDGGSHDNYDRKIRDEFINDLYKEVGLPIKHIRVGENFAEKVDEIVGLLLGTN